MTQERLSIAIGNSLKWVQGNIQYFDPIKKLLPEKQLHKMFSELQFFLSELMKGQMFLNREAQDILDELGSFSRRIILSPEYYEQLQLHPAKFRMYGMAAMYFLSYWKGEDIQTIKDVICRTCNTAFSISPEMPPFRKMEYLYCICGIPDLLYGNADFDPSLIEEYAQRSILCSGLDLANYSIHDEYAITHAVFYLTQMGKRKIIPDKYPNLKQCLLVLAIKNKYEDDLDLLGEYVIDLCICGCHGNENLLTLIDFIINQQRSEGFFSRPQRNYISNTRGTNYGSQNMDCIDNYHTTLVCAMALTNYLRNAF